MRSLFTFTAPRRTCSYLPARDASLEYELVGEMTPGEYLQRMLDGWRRFGHMMFHPACGACRECRALRIDAAGFRPDRSQRRAAAANEGVQLRITPPSVTREKLDLYDRYHAFQEGEKGWPSHAPKDADEYAESFVRHPFPVEEWSYYLGGRLVGVGYVDHLADVPAEMQGDAGLSLIYFFWEPEERRRGLGTFNVLTAIQEARRRRLPWVYMGYYVAGCPSMGYKPRFAPNQLRSDDGAWRLFRP